MGNPNSRVTLAERMLYFANHDSPYFDYPPTWISKGHADQADKDAAFALYTTQSSENDLGSIVRK